MSWLPTAFKEAEAGWKMNWDDSDDPVTGVLNASVGAATGFGAGLLGGNRPYTQGTSENQPGGGTPPLKTHIAGQANNFGRFGDISQQAPGGWIRKHQKNRYGRASTIRTRGTSRKATQNRKGG